MYTTRVSILVFRSMLCCWEINSNCKTPLLPPAVLLGRFPDGESGSDVYNRVSIFEDHLIRDMKAGKFGNRTSIVLVSHGLTLRVFLMRWFNWTVESFLQVSGTWGVLVLCLLDSFHEAFTTAFVGAAGTSLSSGCLVSVWMLGLVLLQRIPVLGSKFCCQQDKVACQTAYHKTLHGILKMVEEVGVAQE